MRHKKRTGTGGWEAGDIDGRRIECDIGQFLRLVQEYETLDFVIQKGVAWVTQQRQTQTGD